MIKCKDCGEKSFNEDYCLACGSAKVEKVAIDKRRTRSTKSKK